MAKLTHADIGTELTQVEWEKDDTHKIGGVASLNVVRSVTLVVAANDTSAQGKAEADYVCDGTADEVQINAALTALPAGGGAVKLLEGNYAIASTIDVPSNVTLEGCGAATILNTSTSYAVANDDPSGGNIGIIIKNLQFHRVTDSLYAVRFIKTTNSLIENIMLDGTGGYALKLETSSNYVTIRNCRTLTGSTHRISVIDSDWVVVEGNILIATGTIGIEVSNSDYCSVTNNIVNGATMCISTHSGSLYTSIIGNHVSNTSDCGISSVEDFVVIANNTVTDCANIGIEIKGGHDIIITGNLCYNNGSSGIWLGTQGIFALSRAVISNNICRGNLQGIFLYGEYSFEPTEVAIVGNNVYSNTTYGIHCYYSLDCVISGNIANSNTVHGIRLWHNLDCVISCNCAAENGQRGISLEYSDHCVVTGNNCHRNSQTTNNTSTNIRVYESDYNAISNNVCRKGALDNKPKYGIEIASGVGNTVHGNNLYASGETDDLFDSGTNTRKRDNIANDGTWLADV